MRVTSCAAAYHGTHPNGHAYTVYEIEATKPDGSRIDAKLHSFEPLTEGREFEVSVTPYQNGSSYTLARVGGSDSDKRLTNMEVRVGAIERVLGMEEHGAS